MSRPNTASGAASAQNSTPPIVPASLGYNQTSALDLITDVYTKVIYMFIYGDVSGHKESLLRKI